MAAPASGQSLRGSRASVDRQNREARQHDFTVLRRPAQIERFENAGLLGAPREQTSTIGSTTSRSTWPRPAGSQAVRRALVGAVPRRVWRTAGRHQFDAADLGAAGERVAPLRASDWHGGGPADTRDGGMPALARIDTSRARTPARARRDARTFAEPLSRRRVSRRIPRVHRRGDRPLATRRSWPRSREPPATRCAGRKRSGRSRSDTRQRRLVSKRPTDCGRA